MAANPKWLELAAQRSAARSWSLGRILDDFAKIEALSREELAMKLGCQIDALEWLALCRRPSVNRFAEDIARIAEHFNLEPSKLAHVVRYVDVLKEMGTRTAEIKDDRFLLAARDRDEEENQ